MHIRAYFHNGTMPEPGTTCDVVDEIFPVLPGILDGAVFSSLTSGEKQLARQAATMHREARLALPNLGLH